MMEQHRVYVSSEGREGEEADLASCRVDGFDFSGLDLTGVYAHGSLFTNCRFVGTDLYYAVFHRASAPGCDFREAMLVKAEFSRSDLSGACFDGAKLTRTLFMVCNLRGATFRGAEVNDSTDMEGSDTTGAIFDGPVPETASAPVADAAEERAGVPPPAGRRSDLPCFYTVNSRPVKMVETPDGRMDVLAYEWKTGGFVRDFGYFSQVLDPWKDVDELSEEQFNALVEELRQR